MDKITRFLNYLAVTAKFIKNYNLTYTVVRASCVISEILAKKIKPFSGSKIINERTDAVAEVAVPEKKNTCFQILVDEDSSLEEWETLKEKWRKLKNENR